MAETQGIDLHNLVRNRPGKNCVILLVEGLIERGKAGIGNPIRDLLIEYVGTAHDHQLIEQTFRKWVAAAKESDDDGELIDLAWLKSINAELVDQTWQEPHPGDIRIGYLYLLGEKSRGRWRFCVYMDGNGVGKIETRGDVRRLCEALGIELKESK